LPNASKAFKYRGAWKLIFRSIYRWCAVLTEPPTSLHPLYLKDLIVRTRKGKRERLAAKAARRRVGLDKLRAASLSHSSAVLKSASE
jgi:hypothetical protein